VTVDLLSWLYGRLGKRYPALFLFFELEVGFLVTAGTIALILFYYEPSGADLLRILIVAEALTLAGLAAGFIRGKRRLRPVRDWIAGERGPEATAAAWQRAVSMPSLVYRWDAPIPFLFVVLPASIYIVETLDLGWTAFFPIFAGGAVAVAYSAILHHFALETGLRPVLIDINRHLPEGFRFQRVGLPLGVKVMAILPVINVITGLVVAALTAEGGGGASLGFSVLVATTVAFTVSFELTALLTKSIMRPLADLERGMERVGEGDYAARVPVTTGDEIGQLAAGFNSMAEGLAERERIREAFGTYLDHEVAEYILSEGFAEGGTEVEVSILIVDARGFTRFAAQTGAAEVVAALNTMFERIVPVIARHGGHIDKFIGDGLLAVFGAPRQDPAHADHAVAAALEIARAVNDGSAGDGLRIGVGINSGLVLAGNIGGAGRLNFSVIGDAVNVAARVEEATRETGDDVLITAATRALLSHTVEVEPRGPVVLKGKDEPIELYAPRIPAPARATTPA